MLKSVENIIFNGVDLVDEFTDDTEGSYLIINEVSGRGIVSKVNNLIEVPYRDGAYPLGSNIPVRRIEVTLTLKGNSFGDLRKKIEKLNSILDTGNAEVPIKFTDELDRVYYGKIDSTDYVLEVSHVSKYHLTIICSDPYKYGPEKEFSFETDYFNIENKGAAEAEPIFELEVKEPITFAMLQNQFDEYNMIGRPIDVTETVPFKKYERIFYSNASSMVGWTNGTYVDGGVVAGQMTSNGTRFQASSYGSGNSWHGPAIKQSLSEILTDFRMEAFISFYNGNLPNYVGRVEIYLLDVNEQVVGKVAIRDSLNSQALTVGEVRAGSGSNSHFLINESGDRPSNWNNFSGQVRIERESNVWRAYIAMVDTATGRHHTRRSVTWVDTENKLTRSVAQVQIHIGQYRTHQTPASGVYSLSVFKINQEPDGIPYIADVGDIITFDHTNNGQIYINGEPFEDTILGADYFTLKKGDNNIVALPDNAFGISGRYRERYL